MTEYNFDHIVDDAKEALDLLVNSACSAMPVASQCDIDKAEQMLKAAIEHLAVGERRKKQ